MLKVRYLFITMWIYYLLYALANVVVESYILEDTVRELEADMKLAGDMALQQTQFLDDFLSFRPDTAYELLMPTNIQGKYEMTDVFEALYGQPVDSEDDLETIYNTVYNNQDFAGVAKLSARDMRVGLRWYDQPLDAEGVPTMSWYTIPRVVTLGSNFVKNLSTSSSIWNGQTLESLEGQSATTAKRDELVKNYGLNETVREIEGMKYFNTPLNIGITYINKDIVSSLFVNNMDLLMRQKYYNIPSSNFSKTSCKQGVTTGNKITKGVLIPEGSENTEYDGKVRTEGVICTGVLRELMDGEEQYKAMNPINNGSYTFLRHAEIDNGTTGKLYKGVEAKIEYKVVDMHDSANNSLLRAVFGNNTSETGGGLGGDKAAYLKGLNMEKLNTHDGVMSRTYEKYPFIVAKVTFYADVILQYRTPLMQELSLLFQEGGATNIGEINPLNNDININNGVRRFEHTVLFAVAP